MLNYGLESSDADNLLWHVNFFRLDASRKLDPDQRAERGQFFTPPSVAQLMASMFAKRPEIMNVLDPGAGVGSLTAALVVELCKRKQKPKLISITAYEIEPLLTEYLKSTFELSSTLCKNVGIEFKDEIFQEDFVAAGVAMVNNDLFSSKRKRFNCVIMNPPYHKINSKSKERKLLRRVNIETSNIYVAFLWLSIKLLESDGELVAITPRSFCNGPYFRVFRQAFFKTMTLRRIHIFESRSKAFGEDDVLQENIIINAVKSTDNTSQKVIISSSIGPEDEFPTLREVSHDEVVNPEDQDAIIHIVPDESGKNVGDQMEEFDCSLKDLDLKVSTGRVVDFRVKDLLRKESSKESVPLIYPSHFSQGFIKWPILNFKKPDSIARAAKQRGLLLPAGYYVLVKRFSSKEEPRRIVAAVYDPNRIPNDMVGFENHTNYYHRNNQGMPVAMAKGLAVFLNSTIVDQYFRQFSGHTQVNATDLRKLKYPSKEKLQALGSKVSNTFPTQDELDRLVREEFNILCQQKRYPIRTHRKEQMKLEISFMH